jgi:hypothetical protein
MHSGAQDDLGFAEEMRDYWHKQAQDEQREKRALMAQNESLRTQLARAEAELNDYAMPFRG